MHTYIHTYIHTDDDDLEESQQHLQVLLPKYRHYKNP